MSEGWILWNVSQHRQGTLEVAPGHLSYVGFEAQAARTYVALHSLERWRYIDNSRA